MPTAKPDEPTTQPAPAPEPAPAEQVDGPSSHDTCGQFPADEVAGG